MKKTRDPYEPQYKRVKRVILKLFSNVEPITNEEARAIIKAVDGA